MDAWTQVPTLAGRHVRLAPLASSHAGALAAAASDGELWRLRVTRVPSQATAEAYVPLLFASGDAYQFDWSHEIVVLNGVTTTVKVAHVRLCHSRMLFVRAYPRETQEMVFDAHDKAFAFFGGACARGIYDNMKTAVDTIFVGRDRAYNRVRLFSRTPGPTFLLIRTHPLAYGQNEGNTTYCRHTEDSCMNTPHIWHTMACSQLPAPARLHRIFPWAGIFRSWPPIWP